MPLAMGMAACPLALLLLCHAHAQPGPSAEDEAARARRCPMTQAQRAAFLHRFAPGLCPMLGGYALLSGLRMFRDCYAAQAHHNRAVTVP